MSQIILDEQIHNVHVPIALRSWITVSRVRELRPDTIIKDEAIPGLLRRLKHPIFVTINVHDFEQGNGVKRYGALFINSAYSQSRPCA